MLRYRRDKCRKHGNRKTISNRSDGHQADISKHGKHLIYINLKIKKTNQLSSPIKSNQPTNSDRESISWLINALRKRFKQFSGLLYTLNLAIDADRFPPRAITYTRADGHVINVHLKKH